MWMYFFFQDEQSSVAMLKKHQILEQAVEDYAETVHQLSRTSRGLVAENHPERFMLFKIKRTRSTTMI